MSPGAAQRAADIEPDEGEDPVVPRRERVFPGEEKENARHEKTGDEDADRNQHAELGEAARVGEEEGEEADRGGERAEENGAAELGDRFGDRRGVSRPLRFAPVGSGRKSGWQNRPRAR